MKRCKRDGCQGKTEGSYCASCIAEVRMCAAEGCPGRLAPQNRRGYCYEHRYIAMKLKRLKSGLIGLVLALLCQSAVAEEPAPCHREAGVGVVCTEEAFGALVDQCVGYDRDGQLCEIRLDAVKGELKATQEALASVQSVLVRSQTDLDKAKADLAKARERSLKPVTGALLTAVGTGLLMGTNLFPSANDGLRAGMGVGGLVMVGTGLWLVW